MSASSGYAMYYTSETNGHPAGYVWNRIAWDGTSEWSPPVGSAVLADSDGKYPIGSTYTASSS